MNKTAWWAIAIAVIVLVGGYVWISSAAAPAPASSVTGAPDAGLSR
jgi:hypothetical protein